MSSVISKKLKDRIIEKLDLLFGNERKIDIYREIEVLISNSKKSTSEFLWLDENDIFLITYGDSIKNSQESPIRTLHNFLKDYGKDIIEYVHILPFYPYSSDDGFSVIDYFKVNSELGDWTDVEKMSLDFKLMFDAVINHISAKSDWFKGYIEGKEEYKDYFIEAVESPELKKVFRPRALPLLTKFKTVNGDKLIWTTFSEDQIDLNYKSEKLFLKIIELLLFYVEKGAKAIRLDAIGFMWKEIGTSCMHLPQTHTAIQLYRDIFEVVAPETLIITETNVPHKDNISYFGNGDNEAQLVYQFPLPPLVLYSMISENAEYLSKWASSLELISDQTTFFNFLASHDGIGVVPTHGILSDEERQIMIDRVYENGGHVSFKTREDGSEIPYELNINYFDAVSVKNVSDQENIDRFICAQSILLSIVGVPAIYIHSLLGSRNYYEGVKETGRYRSINREKLSESELLAEINNVGSLKSRVYRGFKKLIEIRKKERAFHPNSPQEVLFLDDRVFTMIRGDKDRDRIFVLNNVSSKEIHLKINIAKIGLRDEVFYDLVSSEAHKAEGELILDLKPYQVMWLKGI